MKNKLIYCFLFLFLLGFSVNIFPKMDKIEKLMYEYNIQEQKKVAEQRAEKEKTKLEQEAELKKTQDRLKFLGKSYEGTGTKIPEEECDCYDIKDPLNKNAKFQLDKGRRIARIDPYCKCKPSTKYQYYQPPQETPPAPLGTETTTDKNDKDTGWGIHY